MGKHRRPQPLPVPWSMRLWGALLVSCGVVSGLAIVAFYSRPVMAVLTYLTA